MTDARLGAIEEVYRARFAAFVRVAHALCGDEQRARDVVHDGFVRAVTHRRRLRSAGAVEPWLWRIVVNEARRRGSREARLVPVDPAELPEAPAADGDETGELVRLIAELPERQRLALFLRYYADLEYEAIAAALGVAPGTVAATLHAAHRTLRSRIREVEPCRT